MRPLLLNILLILGLQWLVPQWWWILLVPFAFGLIIRGGVGRAFVIGLSSAGLAWFGFGLLRWLQGGGLVAARIAGLLSLGSPVLVLALTVVFAMLAGGTAAGLGRSLRLLVLPDPRA